MSKTNWNRAIFFALGTLVGPMVLGFLRGMVGR